MLRIILYMVFLPVGMLYGQTLAQKYPSYRYVFSEFDVESDFIYNRDFVYFVSRYERRIKRFYRASIQRGENFMPILQRKLVDDGLSDLLIYLSMVESGFTPTIVSSKKAVGLWQFMPKTAKSYNLTVSRNLDERCDPVASTDAAIAHLEHLYEKFGKWYLAIMAYNCGEGRLAKAIKQMGTERLDRLIGSDSVLPVETRLYIQKILLAAMIGESISLGFESMQKVQTKAGVFRVKVDGGACWKRIAKMLEVDSKKLQRLNPQYRSDCLPETKSEYEIVIPEDKIYAFYLRYELQTHSKILESEYMLPHEVKLGDTLEKIAKLYHSDTKSIKVANRKKSDFLEVGEILVVPVSKEQFDRITKSSW